MPVNRIVVMVILCLLSAGCREAPKGPAGKREKVVIALVMPQACLARIAFAKGFFADEGVDAVLKSETSGKAALQSVLDGKADLATVAETPIVFAGLEGKRVAIIASIETANKNLAIVARKDRGISTPAELEGKRIGVSLGTNGEFFMDTFFLAHGIARNKVRVVNLEPEEMAPSLLSGGVDAVSTWQPHVIRSQKGVGDRGVTYYSEELYTESYNAVTMPDYVRRHPDTVERLLRALVRAEEFAGTKSAEAQRHLADCIGVDKALVHELQGVFDLRVTLQESLLIALEDQARWALKRRPGTGLKMHDFLGDIYPDGLLAVKPAAIRLIR